MGRLCERANGKKASSDADDVDEQQDVGEQQGV
jgi:hypothetical protein